MSWNLLLLLLGRCVLLYCCQCCWWWALPLLLLLLLQYWHPVQCYCHALAVQYSWQGLLLEPMLLVVTWQQSVGRSLSLLPGPVRDEAALRCTATTAQ
jgi:hypothetical protein